MTGKQVVGLSVWQILLKRAEGKMIRTRLVGLGVPSLCGAFADAQAMAIVQAVDDGARIILLRHTVMEPSSMMSDAVAYALREKVIVVAAATNWGPAQSRWVGGLNGVVSVEAAYPDGRPHGIGDPEPQSVTVTAPGVASTQGGHDDGRNGSWALQWYDTGPEVAATLVAGILADAAQKWPQATNNQLVESLIRSPKPGVHELVDDPATGYGAVSLARLLEVDPTGYDDVNPLVVSDDGQDLGLTAQDISDARRPVWSDPAPTVAAEPTASPSPAPSPGSSGGVRGWVWWATAALALVVAFGLACRARARASPVDSDDHDRQPTTSGTEKG